MNSTKPNSSESDMSSLGTQKSRTGPGNKLVNTSGIILMTVYVILIFLFIAYVLVKIWPRSTPGGEVTVVSQGVLTPSPGGGGETTGDTSPGADRRPNNPARIEFFWGETWIWDEVRLLLIVIFAGALGSLVHNIRSLYWYVGNRQLFWSWALMYLLLPFSGASIALVFYFVIRGGLFSSQGTFQSTSPFGFAAISAVIGMFSQQAVLKLKDVAETLLTKPEPGANAVPQKSLRPGTEISPITLTTTDFSPKSGSTNGGEVIKITGTGFTGGEQVTFGGLAAASVEVTGGTMITVKTPPHDAGPVEVLVTSMDGKRSMLKDRFTYE